MPLLLRELEGIIGAVPSQKMYLSPWPGWESVVCGGEHGKEFLGRWLGVGKTRLVLASGSGVLDSTPSSADDSLGGLLGLCSPICKRNGWNKVHSFLCKTFWEGKHFPALK